MTVTLDLPSDVEQAYLAALLDEVVATAYEERPRQPDASTGL